MRRDERGPVRLRDILPDALERMGPKGVWQEARVRRAWGEAVGGEVAAHAWVQRLRGSTLEVGVSSDVWGTELRYLGSVLVEKINGILGEALVREIVVRRARGKRDGRPG